MTPQIHRHGIARCDYPVGLNLTKDLEKFQALGELAAEFYKNASKMPVIVVYGSSGIIIGTIVATVIKQKLNHNVEMLVIRKTDNHHDCGGSEYKINKRYECGIPLCIVDDFIGSGHTMTTIYEWLTTHIECLEGQEVVIDSIFVTGSSFVKPDDELRKVKLRNLFIQKK